MPLRDRLVAVNAAQQVKALTENVDLEDTNSLSSEELLRVLEALKRQSQVIHAAAWTQAVTGLRWGEVSALKWEDHDGEKRVLRIRRTAARASSGRARRPNARHRGRTGGAARSCFAAPEQLVAGQHPGLESGLMFPSQGGTPLTNSRISDALQDACKAAGINQRFTSHGFRRTMTDLLRNAQVDPVVAAGLTGHETERMRRHYSTVRTSEAVEAGERVVRLLTTSIGVTRGVNAGVKRRGRRKSSSRPEP